MLGIALSWEEYQQMQQPENSGDTLFTLIPYDEARAIASQRADLEQFYCCYWLGWTVDENLASRDISLAEFSDRVTHGLAWLTPTAGSCFHHGNTELPAEVIQAICQAFGWEHDDLYIYARSRMELKKYGFDGPIAAGSRNEEPYASIEAQEYARRDLPKVLTWLKSFPSYINNLYLEEVDAIVRAVFWGPGNIGENCDAFCYEEIVKASIVPFRDYLPFSGAGEEVGFYTWWEDLAWKGEGPAPQYLKEVLKEILLIKNDHCQFCAYHGVNHLPTQADRDEVLLPHLAGPIADEGNRPYAESCLLGLEM